MQDKHFCGFKDNIPTNIYTYLMCLEHM